MGLGKGFVNGFGYGFGTTRLEPLHCHPSVSSSGLLPLQQHPFAAGDVSCGLLPPFSTGDIVFFLPWLPQFASSSAPCCGHNPRRLRLLPDFFFGVVVFCGCSLSGQHHPRAYSIVDSLLSIIGGTRLDQES